MSRSQTKCLIGSTLGHLGVAAIIVFGAAFVSKQKPPEEALPLLEFIPKTLVDEALNGGGNPEAAEPLSAPVSDPGPTLPKPDEPLPKADPVVIKAVEPESRPPEPKVEERVEKPKQKKPSPKPPVDEPKPQVKIDPEAPKKPAPTKKPKTPVAQDAKLEKPRAKPEIDVDLKPQKSNRDELAAAVAREKAEADRKAARERDRKIAEANRIAQQTAQNKANALSDVLQGLKGGLSQSTAVSIPGPGGEAFANYRQVVRSIYERAWQPPSDLDDDSATVDVEIILARDGHVISSSILTKSGNSSLNRSVQDALNRVKMVAPFPEGAKDTQRTFKIQYNLRSKRRIG